MTSTVADIHCIHIIVWGMIDRKKCVGVCVLTGCAYTHTHTHTMQYTYVRVYRRHDTITHNIQYNMSPAFLFLLGIIITILTQDMHCSDCIAEHHHYHIWSRLALKLMPGVVKYKHSLASPTI